MILPMKPRTGRGGDYVTLPSWMIASPNIKDGDIRLLLLLDLIGWREGRMDGVVRESVEDLAARIGRSPSSVRSSLRRLESLRPIVVIRETGTDSRHDAIRLLYDRYGGSPVNAPVAPRLAIIPAEDTPSNILPEASPIATTGTPIVRSRMDLRAGCTSSEILPEAASSNILPPLPIRERDVVVAVVEGSASSKILPEVPPAGATIRADESDATLTPMPATLAELLAWLPSIEDDPETLARLRKKTPLWLARLKARCPQHDAALIDWMQDALIQSCDKDDPVAYAEWLLGEWVAVGGRPKFEARPKAEPDATDHGVPVSHGPVLPRPVARSNYRDRKAPVKTSPPPGGYHKAVPRPKPPNPPTGA